MMTLKWLAYNQWPNGLTEALKIWYHHFWLPLPVVYEICPHWLQPVTVAWPTGYLTFIPTFWRRLAVVWPTLSCLCRLCSHLPLCVSFNLLHGGNMGESGSRRAISKTYVFILLGWLFIFCSLLFCHRLAVFPVLTLFVLLPVLFYSPQCSHIIPPVSISYVLFPHGTCISVLFWYHCMVFHCFVLFTTAFVTFIIPSRHSRVFSVILPCIHSHLCHQCGRRLVMAVNGWWLAWPVIRSSNQMAWLVASENVNNARLAANTMWLFVWLLASSN